MIVPLIHLYQNHRQAWGGVQLPKDEDDDTHLGIGSLRRDKQIGAEFQLTETNTEKTTMMLRNIPNKFTRSQLYNAINEQGFQGKFNFLYLPIDYKSRCNVG